MPQFTIPLTPQDHVLLRSWVARKSRRIQTRARIILACAKGESPVSVATRIGVSGQTVRKWRQRFLEFGLKGLEDRKRTGAPPRVSAAAVNRLEALLRSGSGCPSSRSLARVTGLSASTVLRIRRSLDQHAHDR
jgi:transposase